MKDENKTLILKELQVIPGVGERTAEDLWELGIRSVADMREKDPEELYLRLCDNTGMKIDRCMLYVFRCAVYYASNEEHDPQLLKWWSWKDNKIPVFTTYQENKTTSDPPGPAPDIP